MSREFTQSMTMHMNGGSKYSELHFRISADGEPTTITRHKLTDGSPRYRITADVFLCGACKAEYDRLAARGVGMMDWLEEHAGHAGPRPDEGGGDRAEAAG